MWNVNIATFLGLKKGLGVRILFHHLEFFFMYRRRWGIVVRFRFEARIEHDGILKLMTSRDITTPV